MNTMITIASLAACFVAACTPTQPERLDVARPDINVTEAATDVTTTIDVNNDVPDAAVDAAVDGGCFNGTPHSRLEFLNHCTDAETTDKVVTLPLARSDGTLPPLP